MNTDELTKRILIIAEGGKNFIQPEEDRPVEEYLENAKKLALAAKEAGADAIKWQTHTVEDEQLDIEVTSPHFKGKDRYSWVTRNTLATPFDAFWKPLKEYCDEIGITFISTPMSRGAAKLLEKLDVPYWKVGSGDLLDFVMLDYIVSTGKPIIISSGMSTLEEIDTMMNYLTQKRADVILLHCVSKYPCPKEDLHLGTIDFFKQRYDVPIGFSDHSIENDAVVAAVAIGAQVIEKHFSFSRELWGADHKVSQTPEEFTELVTRVREVEESKVSAQEILGDDYEIAIDKNKTLQEGEAVFRDYFRKKLHFAKDLPVGHTITKEDVYAMRPAAFSKGMPSEKYEEVLGKTLTQEKKKYDAITEEDIS